MGQDGAGWLAGRIAAKLAALQGKRRTVIAGLAAEIRMRYGTDVAIAVANWTSS
jgi:hypothetical protein